MARMAARTGAKTARVTKGKPRTALAKRRREQAVPLTQQIASGAAAIVTAEGQLTEVVRRSVARTLRQPGRTAAEAVQATKTVAKDAMTAAPDLLATGRAVAKGILLGIADVGGDVVTAANAVATAAAQAAVVVRGEARVVTLRALQGIAEAAQTVGADAGSTARQAISSVSDTVLAAGQTATGLAKQLIETAKIRLSASAAVKRPGIRRRPATRRKADAGRPRRTPSPRTGTRPKALSAKRRQSAPRS